MSVRTEESRTVFPVDPRSFERGGQLIPAVVTTVVQTYTHVYAHVCCVLICTSSHITSEQTLKNENL